MLSTLVLVSCLVVNLLLIVLIASMVAKEFLNRRVKRTLNVLIASMVANEFLNRRVMRTLNGFFPKVQDGPKGRDEGAVILPHDPKGAKEILKRNREKGIPTRLKDLEDDTDN